MFMPSSGEKFGHIILQSLTVGCPIIISDKTPWKHLQEKNIGWDIPLENIDKYVETIELCSEMEQLEYNKKSTKAFEFAQQYMNNPEIISQNLQLFQ